MTLDEYEVEIAHLHALVMKLAERLAAASEVLTKLAERKDKRAVEARARVPLSCDEEKAS